MASDDKAIQESLEFMAIIKKRPVGQQKLILWALRDYLENGGDLEAVLELHGVLDYLKP